MEGRTESLIKQRDSLNFENVQSYPFVDFSFDVKINVLFTRTIGKYSRSVSRTLNGSDKNRGTIKNYAFEASNKRTIFFFFFLIEKTSLTRETGHSPLTAETKIYGNNRCFSMHRRNWRRKLFSSFRERREGLPVFRARCSRLVSMSCVVGVADG